MNNSPSNFDFHRILATIGIILVPTILIIAAVWYLVGGSQTSVPEEDRQVSTSSAKLSTNSASVMGWKTYTNTEAGFSINYPNNYKLIDGVKEENDTNVYFRSNDYSVTQDTDNNPETPFFESSEKGLQVRFHYTDALEANVEEWFESFKESLISDQVLSSKKIKLGDKEAYYIQYVESHGEKTDLAVVLNNGKTYYLDLTTAANLDWFDPERVSQVKIFETMLSNFKFL